MTYLQKKEREELLIYWSYQMEVLKSTLDFALEVVQFASTIKHSFMLNQML